MDNPPHARQTLPFGSVVGKYTIIRCIGQGGFGDIYLVCSNETDQAFAMKVEINEARKQSLHQEVSFMFNVQGSPHFPHLIEFSEDSKHRYLVQELLGPSLSTLRRSIPGGKFKMGTILKIAIQMLLVIEDFHRFGFIHTDIKPANFLLRPGSTNFLVMIDFGLSKMCMYNENGEQQPVPQKNGFAGTKKYASSNALSGADISMKDDIISWFYSILEMSSGNLPWKHELDKDELIRIKSAHEVKSYQGFLDLPERLQKMYDYIMDMDPNQPVDYEYLIDEIVETSNEIDCDIEDKFEWEDLSDFDVMKISGIPLTLEEGKYQIEPEFLHLATTDDGKITIALAEGVKAKKFHPVSTVCRI